jgi:hypothetical protein
LLQLQRELVEDELYRIFFGWIPLPFAIASFIATILFAIASFRAMRGNRANRKYYLFLLNRTAGDCLACLAAIGTAIYVLTSDHILYGNILIGR